MFPFTLFTKVYLTRVLSNLVCKTPSAFLFCAVMTIVFPN